MSFHCFHRSIFQSILSFYCFRIVLCLKAKSLLEQTLAKPDYPSCCEDLLALSYFYLGCCDQKMKLLKSNKADIEVFDNDENDGKALVRP